MKYKSMMGQLGGVLVSTEFKESTVASRVKKMLPGLPKQHCYWKRCLRIEKKMTMTLLSSGRARRRTQGTIGWSAASQSLGG